MGAGGNVQVQVQGAGDNVQVQALVTVLYACPRNPAGQEIKSLRPVMAQGFLRPVHRVFVLRIPPNRVVLTSSNFKSAYIFCVWCYNKNKTWFGKLI